MVIVNGKVWPFKDVEPRKYRMRILNGSNSRFYNLQLTGDPLKLPWFLQPDPERFTTSAKLGLECAAALTEPARE